MKANITSTDVVVEMSDIEGRPHKCRVWEGITETGIPFTAYISTVQVARNADNSQFERELTEHKAPEPETRRAIDLRFVI